MRLGRDETMEQEIDGDYDSNDCRIAGFSTGIS